MARITNDYYLNQFNQMENLSETTKDRYRSRMNYLITTIIKGRSINYILLHPKEIYMELKRYGHANAGGGKRLSFHLILSYLSPILALFRHLENFRTVNVDSYNFWSMYFYNELKRKDRLYNKAKVAELDMERIHFVRDQLSHGRVEKLLLSIPSIPEVVYGTVRLYSPTEQPPAYPPTDYIWLKPSKPILFVKETRKSIPLPKTLLVQINKSLLNNPRTYLFTNKRGLPMNANEFGRFANQLLRPILDDPTFTIRQLLPPSK